ncbi:MAG: hypothetical protein DRI69_02070 [Bacteroidetes bacterium]|nr:MAG: hypothetical protein DRI69_02070 [Bacteroidota bacterium]
MKHIACIGILTLLMLGSCGKRTIRLDRTLRRAIDTTAAKQMVILRPILDSLCEERYDSLVQAAVDSIMERRQLEIKQIISDEGK